MVEKNLKNRRNPRPQNMLWLTMITTKLQVYPEESFPLPASPLDSLTRLQPYVFLILATLQSSKNQFACGLADRGKGQWSKKVQNRLASFLNCHKHKNNYTVYDNCVGDFRLGFNYQTRAELGLLTN